MERKYTIKEYKLLKEVIESERTSKWFILYWVRYKGQPMHAYFCKNDSGMYVVLGKTRYGKPSKGLDIRWASTCYVDVYYRRNFLSAEDGNRFYKRLKDTKELG